MPEFSLPFDSIASDEREYPAEQFVQYLKPLVNTGILTDPDTLKVEADEGMTVKVNTGYAWIEGYVYSLYDVPLTVTLAGADNTLDRIDRIVLRLDLSLSARSIEVRVLQGEPAANPVPPALTREGNIYELSLAQVRVTAGRSFIDTADIMDERGDEELCPVVSSNILPSINDALQTVIDMVEAHIGAGGDAHALVTTSQAGFMSPGDKNKMDNLGVNTIYNRNPEQNILLSDIMSGSAFARNYLSMNYDDLYIYLGDDTGYLTCLNKSDLSQNWRVRPATSSYYIVGIYPNGSYVYVAVRNLADTAYRIYRLTRTSGSVSGSYTSYSDESIIDVAFDGSGNVYVARSTASSPTHRLQCFTSSLSLRANRTLTSNNLSIRCLASSNESDVVYVGMDDRYIHKYSYTSNSSIWMSSTGGSSYGIRVLLEVGNYLVCGTQNDYLQAITVSTGQLVTSQNAGSGTAQILKSYENNRFLYKRTSSSTPLEIVTISVTGEFTREPYGVGFAKSSSTVDIPLIHEDGNIIFIRGNPGITAGSAVYGFPLGILHRILLRVNLTT